MPKPSEFHEVIDREIPTIIVKRDLPIGYYISRTIPNIIPFVAITTVDYKNKIKFITDGKYHWNQYSHQQHTTCKVQQLSLKL